MAFHNGLQISEYYMALMMLHHLKIWCTSGAVTLKTARVACAIFPRLWYNLLIHVYSAHCHYEMNYNIAIQILAD